MPPAKDDVDAGTRFWVRLVEWAEDKRLRLGPSGQQFLVTALAETGWPDFEPPACPAALKRSASQAMNRLIGQVVYAPDTAMAAAPTLAPVYVRDAAAGESIALDASTLDGHGLGALATETEHWSTPATAVHFKPPPPEMLPFVHEPHGDFPGQQDLMVARNLRDRRIVVIGGIPGAALPETLRDRFAILDNQLAWIGSEKNERVNLDLLDGLRSERDLVFCIAGHVGHDTREAVQKKCRKLGVRFRYAETPNMIVELLSSDLSRSTT
jgi:hypothetical protein